MIWIFQWMYVLFNTCLHLLCIAFNTIDTELAFCFILLKFSLNEALCEFFYSYIKLFQYNLFSFLYSTKWIFLYLFITNLSKFIQISSFKIENIFQAMQTNFFFKCQYNLYLINYWLFSRIFKVLSIWHQCHTFPFTELYFPYLVIIEKW
jgi:hypothetical protein